MTAAPAAAPTPGPVAPPPTRAASHISADPFAFAAVLDSLPSEPAEAGALAPEDQPRSPNESQRKESSREQTARSPLNESALLASLPFALRAPSMMDERSQAAGNSPSLASLAMKVPKSEDSGTAIASASAATVGRLIGERAFHFAASASRPLAVRAPFAPASASAANLTSQAGLNDDSDLVAGLSRAAAIPMETLADAVQPSANPTAPERIAPQIGGTATGRVSAARTAAHEAARSVGKPEGSAAPPLARVTRSTSPPAPVGSSAKEADGRQPDPIPNAAPSTTQTTPFGAQLSASFDAAAFFQPDGSTAKTTDANTAPRTTAPAAGLPPSAQPVKEIDVDLSPGGLEDVSMTMRLAGEKLSVVIRAGSSQTLNSIEGARDAIADRLAAIGQPVDSLVVKQTDVNTDGNTNANMASADDGAAGETERSAQGASEWGASNDALPRRGPGRDRSF
jgi:hypothetical protein